MASQGSATLIADEFRTSDEVRDYRYRRAH